MKKLIAFFSACFLLLTAFAHPGRTDARGGHYVTAEGWGYAVGTYHYHDKYGGIVPVEEQTGMPTGISVSVDGERVFFDVPPQIIDGRTLIPIRAVCEKLGCSVYWHEETETVVILSSPDAKAVVQTDEGIHVTVDGETVIFDVPPQIIDGRTLIPIRAVCEKLGCTVDWDGALQVVYIESAAYRAAKAAEAQQVQTLVPTAPAVSSGSVDRSTPSVSARTGVTVYVTDSGSKFHTASCRYAQGATAVDLSEALAAGLTPCGVCKP